MKNSTIVFCVFFLTTSENKFKNIHITDCSCLLCDFPDLCPHKSMFVYFCFVYFHREPLYLRAVTFHVSPFKKHFSDLFYRWTRSSCSRKQRTLSPPQAGCLLPALECLNLNDTDHFSSEIKAEPHFGGTRWTIPFPSHLLSPRAAPVGPVASAGGTRLGWQWDRLPQVTALSYAWLWSHELPLRLSQSVSSVPLIGS